MIKFVRKRIFHLTASVAGCLISNFNVLFFVVVKLIGVYRKCSHTNTEEESFQSFDWIFLHVAKRKLSHPLTPHRIVSGGTVPIVYLSLNEKASTRIDLPEYAPKKSC
jgi:hypothetical protein